MGVLWPQQTKMASSHICSYNFIKLLLRYLMEFLLLVFLVCKVMVLNLYQANKFAKKILPCIFNNALKIGCYLCYTLYNTIIICKGYIETVTQFLHMEILVNPP